jgi:hypothetical protein
MKENRKFKLILISLFIATGALFFGKATFDAWSLFTLGIIGFYFGANVYQKKIETDSL